MRIEKAQDLLNKLREELLVVDAKMVSDLNHANERVTTLVRYKTKGFIDGAVKILVKSGMKRDKAYSVADELWEIIKREL